MSDLLKIMLRKLFYIQTRIEIIQLASQYHKCLKAKHFCDLVIPIQILKFNYINYKLAHKNLVISVMICHFNQSESIQVKVYLLIIRRRTKLYKLHSLYIYFDLISSTIQWWHLIILMIVQGKFSLSLTP
jgi:hypothetical protein